MTKHIILWTLKEECDKEKVKREMKENLEALMGKIPGLLSICVYTEGLPTSNADVCLDSCFENPEALKRYAVHPEHVAVADQFVRPYTSSRTCMDFEVE